MNDCLRCGSVALGTHECAIKFALVTGGDKTIDASSGRPCIVPMLRGSDGFDPDYFVDLNDLTGGALAI